MASETAACRLILSLAPDQAYLPLARTILANMGYRIVSEHERSGLSGDLAQQPPVLWIVDESRLGELPGDPSDPTPVIVIAGPRGIGASDPRVIGAVRRPAGLHELFRLFQQALEDVPRSAPRVPTDLPARCGADGRGWAAAGS